MKQLVVSVKVESTGQASKLPAGPLRIVLACCRSPGSTPPPLAKWGWHCPTTGRWPPADATEAGQEICEIFNAQAGNPPGPWDLRQQRRTSRVDQVRHGFTARTPNSVGQQAPPALMPPGLSASRVALLVPGGDHRSAARAEAFVGPQSAREAGSQRRVIDES